MAGAHAARQVGTAFDRSLPLADDGLKELGVAGLDGHVDRAAAEIQSAHCVAPECLGVPDRHVVLEVGAAVIDVGQGRPAAALDEAARLLEVALLARLPEQFHQRHLDHRVAAHASLGERFAHVVGGTPRDRDELVLAAGAQARDRCLDHVPVAVELVAPFEVGVPVLAAAMAVARVEVAVLLLGVGHLRGDLIDLPVERPVPGHRLDHLVDVGVRELSPRLSMRIAEVVDPPEPGLPRVAVRDERRPIEVLAPAPEAALEADVDQRLQDAGTGSDRFSHGLLLT